MTRNIFFGLFPSSSLLVKHDVSEVCSASEISCFIKKLDDGQSPKQEDDDRFLCFLNGIGFAKMNQQKLRYYNEISVVT
jgi:hypothetical protein